MAKKRGRTRGHRVREVETREPIQRFLIVCEGEKTEPNYFRGFKVPTHPEVPEVKGTGFNTRSLVEETMRLMREKGYDPQKDQVWCVFDRDSFSAEEFNAALSLAANNQIQIAYSNECFELWYYLHFQYLESGLPRSDYVKLLGKCLGHSYRKNSEGIYEELWPRQEQAIANAKRLLVQYVPPNPERDNPSTTVHKLVEELNRFVR
ncbi:MAG: RloB family protein [Chloroflexota bacterium]